MTDTAARFGSAQAAQQIGITLDNLHQWLSRHPGYRPRTRISDDLLWTHHDIESVRQARATRKRSKRS